MASSLFSVPQTNLPQNNMVKQFLEFKKQMAGKDPKQVVEQLLQSGAMTRQQFEQYASMAKQFFK